MKVRNLFAYTEPKPTFPGYVSLNEADGRVRLAVRSPGHNGTQVAEIELSHEVLQGLEIAFRTAALRAWLHQHGVPV